MRGILELDCLCLKEILKFTPPLDLCSMRNTCTQLRDFVDDYCRSLYFVREQWFHLNQENNRNVDKIFKTFGKFIRHLRVSGWETETNLLLDMISTYCGATFRGLSLNRMLFYEIDMKRFIGIFNNLEILELIRCYKDQRYIENFLLGHAYPNLTTLIIRTNVETEILREFFLRPRNIKKLCCDYIPDGILPLIALNAAEIEELNISPTGDSNLMTVTLLKKLKRLVITDYHCEESSIIALIKEVSVNNLLEVLGIYYLTLSEELCEALRNLTNLKELQLMYGKCEDTISLKILGQNLSNLESLTVAHCPDFPYRDFLDLACKSFKFRTINICAGVRESIDIIEQMVKEFSGGIGHWCFVSGRPLYIYLDQGSFNAMKGLLTQANLRLIEKYGNVKILHAKRGVFFR